jgi:hypothetical protein
VSTLTDDEMWRIKAELFDNVLGFGAEPYIGVRAIYNVIQQNVTSSSVSPTTSTTAVTSAGPVVLTLASVTGLAASSRIVLDVDNAREVVTVRAVTGSTISVVVTKTHSGTYPVEVESGLTIVRGLLADLETLDQQERITIPNGGVKRVDEIEFFSRAEGNVQQSLTAHRNAIRSRLASATGLTGILRELAARVSAGGGSTFEVY